MFLSFEQQTDGPFCPYLVFGRFSLGVFYQSVWLDGPAWAGRIKKVRAPQVRTVHGDSRNKKKDLGLSLHEPVLNGYHTHLQLCLESKYDFIRVWTSHQMHSSVVNLCSGICTKQTTCIFAAAAT